MTESSYRPDIDGLRAFAVLLVLAFHAFPGVLPGGFIGVDVFFAISGFLISNHILNDLGRSHFSLSRFYQRRIKRIFPALILVLLTCLLFGWFGLLADEYKMLGKHVFSASLFFINFTLWQEAGYFDVASQVKPLLHLWSLSIEEQFYLLWPLILVCSHRRKATLWFVFLTLIVCSFALNIYLLETASAGNFYSSGSRFWEILLGGLLAISSPKKAFANTFSIVSLCLLAAGVYLSHPAQGFPGWVALFPTLGTVMFIAAGPHALFNRHLFSQRPLVGIGLISYPLYLWHWPLLSFAEIIESSVPSLSIRISALALSFILAWMTYELVEKPVRRSSSLIAWVLCMLVALLGGAGVIIYKFNGLPQRSSVAGQKNNFDKSYKQSCAAWSDKSDDSVDNCNGGSGSRNPPILLLGDSHANAFTTVFDAMADRPKVDYRQLGLGQCPLLLGYGYPRCREFTEQILAKTVADPSIKTVVLANRWALYFSCESILGADKDCDGSQFIAALDRTLKYLEDSGKRVVFVYSVPPAGDPKRCITRPIRLTDRNFCNMPAETAFMFEGGYRKPIQEILQRYPLVKTFDPWPLMCDKEFCHAVDGDRLFYIDRVHLSKFGGERIARLGRKELIQALF